MNGGDGAFAPLHYAARYVNIEVIDLLIGSGADVNRGMTEDSDDLPAGTTPLHFAAQGKALIALKRLLEAGADPNIADSAGQTPLS